MGETIKLSLSKSERLRNVQQITELFTQSKSIKAYPLIFNYVFPEEVQQTPLQLVFSAPKRNFRKAVDRNRVKRVMRDRLRLLKPLFLDALNGKSIRAALIYTSKELPDHRLVDKSLHKIIKQLHDQAGA